MKAYFSKDFFRDYIGKRNLIWFLLTLSAFISLYISPEKYYLVGFWAWTIPLWLIIQLFWLIYWFFFKTKRIFLPLLSLLLGFGLINRTFTWHLNWTKSEKNFQVLSYNVRVFNSYSELSQAKPGSSAQMIEWLANHPAEIKCLQEFYHLTDSQDFNTIKEIADKQKYHFFVSPMSDLQDKNGFFGTVIFSKFPIIQSGFINLGKQLHQRGIWVDVVIQKDTLRVFNIHLKSMNIDDKIVLESNIPKNRYVELWEKLKNGFRSRARQVLLIEKFIQTSPYPVILCGDLNELPYSFVYQRFSRYLNNSFELAGKGFGFSYNGNIPCLRIDNQFFSPKLQIHNFQTLDKINFSDHFPLLAEYSFH